MIRSLDFQDSRLISASIVYQHKHPQYEKSYTLNPRCSVCTHYIHLTSLHSLHSPQEILQARRVGEEVLHARRVEEGECVRERDEGRADARERSPRVCVRERERHGES
ncbi:hypothetical protein O6H91_03G094600 [Diphasiastrum complanatum]|uniref:Uncharacterized protein n=1 Tax=Diphasiastrum complanatum TaxID=34168 RepID=A0ACC2E963_DIPCM|nr:hypothetical protein O6H91_03G094600 [Diphasiastrum complanatum]